MRKLLSVLGAVAMVALLPAMALAITIPAGPIRFHLTNYETFVVGGTTTSFTPVVGAELRALLSIDQGITGFAGGSTFFTGGPGGDSNILGALTGAVISTVTSTPAGFNVTFTGGTINLYESAAGPIPTPLFANIGLAGPAPASPFTAGTLIATLTLRPGIGPFPDATTTLASTALISSPPTSLGNFYADVTGGTLKSKLDTDFFGPGFVNAAALALFGPADIQGQTTVIQEDPAGNPLMPYGCDAAGHCFYFTSSDPVKAFATPYPPTVLLLGASLLGLAGATRLTRRRSS